MASNIFNIDRTFQRVVPMLFYGATFLIVAFLFAENFIFSESISILQFREIDDLAFQQVLRDAHMNLQRGNWFELLKLTSYAYGWIYWAPLVVITYPAFLLSQNFSIDWLLIVMPRDLSLMFTVLSMVYIRKILKVYAAPEWLCSIGVLIYALLPTTGYFSLRFGTVAEVALLSALTIYLCVKNQTLCNREVRIIALALALTGSVKLSGLLITPLVIYFVVVRAKLSTRDVLINSLLFLLLLAAFTYPLLLVSPFKLTIAREYFGMLKHFLEVTRLSMGQISFTDKIYTALAGNFYYASSFITLITGLFLAGSKSESNRLDFIAMGCMLVISLVYLTLSVSGAYSISSYFTSVSYLLIFGIFGFFHITKLRFIVFLLPIILLGGLTYTAMECFESKSSGFNLFSYYIKRVNSAESIDLSYSIEDCIQSSGGYRPGGHVFKDHSIQLLTNTINNPDQCISNAWNDLNPAKISCGRPIDYLILDNIHPFSLLSQAEFNQLVNSSDSITADNLRTDRLNRGLLISKGAFGSESFSTVCKLNGAAVYKNNMAN